MCVGDGRNCRLRPECLESTREKGKQEVKRVELDYTVSVYELFKANTKIGVGIDRWSLYILTTSDQAIGERAVATGVITPEVCEGLIAWLRLRWRWQDRDCVIATAMGKIAMCVRGRGGCCLCRELCTFAQSPKCTFHVRMVARRVHNIRGTKRDNQPDGMVESIESVHCTLIWKKSFNTLDFIYFRCYIKWFIELSLITFGKKFWESSLDIFAILGEKNGLDNAFDKAMIPPQMCFVACIQHPHACQPNI
jgi:hypothetical protein